MLLAASLATRACRFSSGVHMTSSNWNTNCTRMRPSRMKSVRADNDFSLVGASSHKHVLELVIVPSVVVKREVCARNCFNTSRLVIDEIASNLR